ncbi:MAG: hypothetical protein ABSE48_03555, partial [Verrucomicrobiota bacterium]
MLTTASLVSAILSITVKTIQYAPTRVARNEPCAQSQSPFSAVGGSSKEHPLLRTHAVWLVPVLSAFCLASPLPAQIA